MDYDEIARDMADVIEQRITPLLGTAKAQKAVGESAGGGMTKYIDKVAEDAVLTYVKENDIECQLITEEAGIIGDKDLKIILDPLDGTTNALTSIPFYAVSLAFWGDSHYGFVKNLCNHDVYEAYQGGTPLKNGKKILSDCTESVASGYIGKGFQKVLPLFDAWRCLGSLALELSYVAEGKIAALVDLREKARIVDVAGAQIIAEAAGVIITDEKGNNPFDTYVDVDNHFLGKIIIGARPDIHKKLLTALHGSKMD